MIAGLRSTVARVLLVGGLLALCVSPRESAAAAVADRESGHPEEASLATSTLVVAARSAAGEPVQVTLCLDHQSRPDDCQESNSQGLATFAGVSSGTYLLEIGEGLAWTDPLRHVAVPPGVEVHRVELELTSALSARRETDPWSGGWGVTLDTSSGWSLGGTVRVTGSSYARATAHLVLRHADPASEDFPRLEASGELELSEEEERDLLAALRSTNLFDGDYAGIDARAVDFAFSTVTVANSWGTAILVTSGNPSFELGPRRELLDLLYDLYRRMEEAHDRATDAAAAIGEEAVPADETPSSQAPD